MYAFLSILLAVGVLIFGYAQDLSLGFVWVTLGCLFFGFVTIRNFLHRRSDKHLAGAHEELLRRYMETYGNTSTGQNFLHGTRPWHDGLFRAGAKRSLFTGDWEAVFLGGIAEFVGNLVTDGMKPAEQNVLERQISRVLELASARRKAFTNSVTISGIAYLLAAVSALPGLGSATYVKRWLGQEPRTNSLGPQLITATEAQRIAVSRYPDVGVSGSKLNRDFVVRYKHYKQTRPGYFDDPSWPIRLADEIAQPALAK
jgi:hypothetical protein